MKSLDLDATLGQLQSAQLVGQLPAEEAFTFKHTLTQETAYGSLLTRKRREIHRLVARANEELYPAALDDNSPLLAEHYWQAGDKGKTLDYATRSGDTALRIYANAEAAAHYHPCTGLFPAKRRDWFFSL